MKRRNLMLSVLFIVVIFVGNLFADDIPAKPIEISGNNANPYRSDLDVWEGAWQAPQAIYDRGTYQDDPDNWYQSNSDEGSTWYNSSTESYGILVIDMKQSRTLNEFRVFQMFSDGKTTGIEIYKNTSFLGDTQPSSSDSGWESVTNGIVSVSAGTNNTTYISDPTIITVSDFSSRYIMLHVYNDGTLGSQNYIELKGIKGFYKSAKSYSINYLRGGEESTLPVELSSFTAIQTESNLAQLNWITQSETDILGYNVYRNISDEENSRIKINSVIIAAENSSNENNYTFTDKNVEMSNTYYYWLESVDLDGSSQFFGPVNITLGSDDPQNPDAPEIPINPGIQKIYPNPFNPRTTISYYLDKDTDVTIKIYNAKGQKVNEFNQGVQKGQTMHFLVWNGKNSNSENVGSGVYFFKLNAGKIHQIKKAILLK